MPAELGGPLGDVGSHCLYMAEHLTGSRIRSLACTYLPATLSLAVENGAFVQFETAGGVQGSARVAFNQPRGGPRGTLGNWATRSTAAKGSCAATEPCSSCRGTATNRWPCAWSWTASGAWSGCA